MDKDALLALALDHIAAEGLRTLSLTGLAERAGVSRATVYRMFSGRADLIGQLAAAEMKAMTLASLGAVAIEAPTAQVTSDLVIFALGYVRGHAALGRLRRTDPESLLTLAISHDAEQVTVIELAAAHLEPMLALPRHRVNLAMTPIQAAEYLVRIVLSHFLSESRGLDDRTVAAAASRAVRLP